MSDPFRILQIGLGTIGLPVSQLAINRNTLDLVAVVDVNPEIQGKSVEEILELGTAPKTMVYESIRAALVDLSTVPDVALILTSSDLKEVAPIIIECLELGMDVVSICEELSYPSARHPELTRKIDEAARRANKTVLGTGINPGYLMDLLPIVLTAPCQYVETIHVTRVIDSSRRRASFQKKIGTGMSESEFREAIKNRVITGHVGLMESMRMINDALNLGADKFEEFAPEPVIAEAKISTHFATIEPGNVIGLKSRATASYRDLTMIEMNFVAYAGANPEYDEIQIDGYPDIHQRIEGGVMGDIGTVAMVLNMIPIVFNAPAGLHTMKDLPVPRNAQTIYKE